MNRFLNSVKSPNQHIFLAPQTSGNLPGIFSHFWLSALTITKHRDMWLHFWESKKPFTFHWVPWRVFLGMIGSLKEWLLCNLTIEVISSPLQCKITRGPTNHCHPWSWVPKLWPATCPSQTFHKPPPSPRKKIKTTPTQPPKLLL